MSSPISSHSWGLSLRRWILSVSLLCSAMSGVLWGQNLYEIGQAKEKEEEAPSDRGRGLQAFLLHPTVVDMMPTSIDSMALDFYHRRKVEGRSLFVGYLGNMISPMHHKSFFARRQSRFGFLYNEVLNDLVYNSKNTRFYRTRSPYTNVSYQRNGNVQQREDELDFTLAISANRFWGFGADFNYTESKGYYIGNHSKMINYRIFGNISLPRYEAWAYMGNNYMNMTENGGVERDDYIFNPGKYSSGRHALASSAIPVRFPSSVWNQLRNGHFLLAHRYNLGSYQLRSTRDTLNQFGERASKADSLVFVPVAGISHRFSYRQANRTYINKLESTWAQYPNRNNYYRYTAGQDAQTLHFYPFDSTDMRQIDNTFQLSLREGFKPWVKMGIDVYTRLENKYYAQQDSVATHDRHHAFNVVVGGRLARQTGKRFNFDAVGEITMLGEELGAMLLDGRVDTHLGPQAFPIDLDAWGRFTNQKPNYFLAHHHGSFHRWDLDLGFQRELLLGGRIQLPKWGVAFKAETATWQNYIYFAPSDRTANGTVVKDMHLNPLPIQVSQPIQVLALDADYQSGWGFLGWHLKGLYQTSSNPTAIPLPQWSAYGSLYTNFYVARVMRTQVGIDCTWHSNYYVPYYEPATMQFVNQHTAQYGNFPLINVFANFRLKRTRFFFEYYNVGDLVIAPSRRFSVAHYPVNPPSFRMGICVDFNN